MLPNAVARCRGVLLVVAFAAAADWAVKAWGYPYVGEWIPHRTDRAALNLLPIAAGCLALVSVIPGRRMLVGAGLALGGATANMLDLEVDGVVWDMIPIPYTQTIANVADVFIVSGIVLTFCAAIPFYVNLCKKPDLDGPASPLAA